MKKQKTQLTKDELQFLLSYNNIKVRKSYEHDDYMYTSFTMPYDYKERLDKLCEKYNMTRSAFFRMLLDNFNG